MRYSAEAVNLYCRLFASLSRRDELDVSTTRSRRCATIRMMQRLHYLCAEWFLGDRTLTLSL